MLVNINDYMLDGHVEQPAWISPNYRNFMQTYDFDKNKLQNNIVLYFKIENGYMYNFFNFFNRKTYVEKEQIETKPGILTHNKFLQFQSAIIPSELDKVNSLIKAMCEICKSDAFYAENVKYDDYIEMTHYLEAFADLYFSYGWASGDYKNIGYEKRNLPDNTDVQ